MSNPQQQHTEQGEMRVLTVYLGAHCFGIDILTIEDVIRRQPKTPVPLAAPYVAGLLNLRGHVVTEIDMAQVLEVAHEAEDDATIGEHSLIIRHEGELYSMVFDRVGEVITLPQSRIESLPETIDDEWKELARGIYRLEDELVALLDLRAIIRYLAARNDAATPA